MTEQTTSACHPDVAHAEQLLLATEPQDRNKGIWLAYNLIRDELPGSARLVHLLRACALHDMDHRNRVDAAGLYCSCTGDIASIVSSLNHLALQRLDVDTLSDLADVYATELIGRMIDTLEPMLLELLERGDVESRLAALRHLLNRRSDEIRVADVAKARLRVETNPLVLGSLLQLFAAMPGMAHQVLPEMRGLSTHSDQHVKLSICQVLAALGPQDEVLDLCIALLRDEDDLVRSVALANLIRFGSQSSDVLIGLATVIDVLPDDVLAELRAFADRLSQLFQDRIR